MSEDSFSEPLSKVELAPFAGALTGVAKGAWSFPLSFAISSTSLSSSSLSSSSLSSSVAVFFVEC